MPTGGTTTGANGFPRGSTRLELRTRRAAARLAGTNWLVGPGLTLSPEGQFGINAGAGITINGAGQVTASGATGFSVNTSVPGGNTVANTAAETTFSSSYVVAANSLSVGSVVRLTMQGTLGTKTATPGVLTFKTKWGAVSMGSESGTLTAGGFGKGWYAQFVYSVNAIGASGSIESDGWVNVAITPAAGPLFYAIVGGAVTIDTTAAQTITATVTFSVADVTNTITLRQFLIELLG